MLGLEGDANACKHPDTSLFHLYSGPSRLLEGWLVSSFSGQGSNLMTEVVIVLDDRS